MSITSKACGRRKAGWVTFILFDLSRRFKVRIDDVANGADYVAPCCFIQRPDGATLQIELCDVQREQQLTLGHAILIEPELTCPKGDTIGQLGAGFKLGRRDEERDDCPSAIQFFARHDDDGVRATCLEVGHVDFAGANHQYGFSRASRAACLRAKAWRAACSRSSCSSSCIALKRSAGKTTTSRPSSGAANCTGLPLSTAWRCSSVSTMLIRLSPRPVCRQINAR